MVMGHSQMKLFKHQVQALEWLKPRPKAILALDMGLGKSAIASLDLSIPAIVVCPASLKLNWKNELKIWRPELSVHVVKQAKDALILADVTIVNYDILSKIDLPKHETLVIDECHYIKSHKAKRTKLLMGVIRSTPKVRLLSGTPISNRPNELWTLLYSIGATKLGWFEFGMRFCAGWRTPWDTFDFTGSSNQKALKILLEPVMIRMTKEQCLTELPSKTFRIISLDLPVDKREKAFSQDQIDKPDSIPFEAISDIRKLNAERKLDPSISYICDLLEQTDKIVVFAHHTHIIAALAVGLKDYAPVIITGATKNEDRQKAVDTFQTDPKCRVFIGNIKAAGVGLTLTAANHVVFVEASWSPAEIHQGADRCLRIGQKKNVTVDLLSISGSIDELILHKVLSKMDVISNIIMESQDMNEKLIAAKLRELANLFDMAEEAPKTVEQEAKPVKAIKPVPTDPEKQIELPGSTHTLDDVRTSMAKLIGAGKRDQALAILAKFGVAKVSDIPEDKFASVLAAVADCK
jgi:SWI/SNF-related matrix-associated actin-dependent regulator of chromatin subfamily A-like protein 1